MATAVYGRIFDDVFMVTSVEKRLRSGEFSLYYGENTPDVFYEPPEGGLDLVTNRKGAI